MCRSTVLYITRCSTTWLSSMTASASLNQAVTSFSQNAASFTLRGTACSTGLAGRALLYSRARSRFTIQCNSIFSGSQDAALGLHPLPVALMISYSTGL